MAKKPVWKQISPRLFAMESGGRRIELRYEGTGFQGGWGVYADGAFVRQRPGFMEARRIALTLVGGQ
ncbi:MAG TPA: hypothetical protein VD978_35750 [Azospirillum sp.]|nr:hypothetical protein [Azospirillum sp.]